MKKLFALFISTLFIASSAIAEEETSISIVRYDPIYETVTRASPDIYINGPISNAAVAKFTAIVSSQPTQAATVHLNSPGGDLLAGIKLGRLIREFGFSTSVGIQGEKDAVSLPGVCFSACVLAYIGGYYRNLNEPSKIGVHRFSTKSPKNTDLDVAQIISAAIIGHLKESDVDTDLFKKMAQTGKDEIHILTAQENESLGVVNNGSRPSTWSIQNNEELMYLKGEQQTWRGIGKILFLCRKGRLVIGAFYEAGENAELITESTNRYSLRVNNDFSPVTSIASPPKAFNGFVSVYFAPTPNQIRNMLAAKSIGFAFHPPNPEIYYGFLVDVGSNHKQILNYIKYCNTQRK